MKADYRVVLDACVLANYGVCDLLLRLAERPRLFLPCWSEEILEEVRRTQQEKLGWPESLVDSFQREVRIAFPEAMVRGYEPLAGPLQNAPEDRHVLAAAIRGGASLILTFNLKDFPQEALAAWGIEACHPQDYLLTLYEFDPARVMIVLGEIAGRKKIDVADLLLKLGVVLPCFAGTLLERLEE